MPFVLAVDRSGPRPAPDNPTVDAGRQPPGPAGFEPTTGTELQAVLTDAGAVVDVTLELVRSGGWSIGIGAGPVPTLQAEGTRAANGTALLCARRAIDAARRRPVRLAVRGHDPVEAADAQAVLTALGAVVLRRSEQAWAAITLVAAGRTQAQAAMALGISRQAVGQRLAAGQWDLETELRPAAAHLLTRAE